MERIEYDNLSARKKKALEEAWRTGNPPACLSMSFEDYVARVGSPDDRLVSRLAPSEESVQRRELDRAKFEAERAQAEAQTPEENREALVQAAMSSESAFRAADYATQAEARSRIAAGHAQAKAKSDLDAYNKRVEEQRDRNRWGIKE